MPPFSNSVKGRHHIVGQTELNVAVKFVRTITVDFSKTKETLASNWLLPVQSLGAKVLTASESIHSEGRAIDICFSRPILFIS